MDTAIRPAGPVDGGAVRAVFAEGGTGPGAEGSVVPAGYAAQVLTPLSVTGVVVFTACLVLIVLAGLGIVALVRGRRGE